jgi:hypothetical protein
MLPLRLGELALKKGISNKKCEKLEIEESNNLT